ncbi:hypothetical protein AAES_165360 [Amazona aestiva]|uniref:Uncharacterized protein n=1 Tax=Amazona aestiva TaxID=12930 RepID=A0A0Q3LTI2_AMAAE|nr:hypothetical protein AAES_165360 [Amazona aestiva]
MPATELTGSGAHQIPLQMSLTCGRVPRNPYPIKTVLQLLDRIFGWEFGLENFSTDVFILTWKVGDSDTHRSYTSSLILLPYTVVKDQISSAYEHLVSKLDIAI